jgi:hypothetical protein
MNQDIIFPVEINGFIFYDDSFILKNCKHAYSSIASIKFHIINTSINFSKDETYAFEMRTATDEIVGIHISDAAFSFNKKKVAEKKRTLLSIANYINQITFQRRLDAYLAQLRTGGCLQYKIPNGSLLNSRLNTVFIYESGDISLAGKTVNLKRARDAGTLKFGTAYGLGCDRSINPFEISINEKPPIFRGIAEGLGSVRFDAGWDFPMIFEILKIITKE